MALVTFCPSCNTAFRVNATQLQTHNGDVRCGSCQLIFNGFSTLITIHESAIVSSSSAAEINTEIAAPSSTELPNLPVLPTQPSESRLSKQSQSFQQDSLPSLQPPFQPRLQAGSEVDTLFQTQSQMEHQAQTYSSATIENSQQQSESPIGIDSKLQTVAQVPLSSEDSENQHSLTESLADNLLSDNKQPLPYGWQVFFGFANILLVLLLAMQITYHYRTELTMLAPDNRPMLERYCQVLGCSIPYPKKIEQLGIETSDLQKNETGQPVISTLTAVIRNHAAFPQALPILQLSLLNAKDQLTASRLFTPQEYLSNENHTKQFIEAHDDLEIHLDFDNTQLDAFGYRLNLLYL